jgi:hypothetical protein
MAAASGESNWRSSLTSLRTAAPTLPTRSPSGEATGTLEAKLIDGDEKGKVRVRVASEVTGDKAKGYTYTYVVENRTDKPIKFKWAGLAGTVAAGKSFTKSEPSKELTREELT